MKIEIFPDSKYGGVRKRGLVCVVSYGQASTSRACTLLNRESRIRTNVEEGVVDSDQREDDEIDLSNELFLFLGINDFVQFIGVGKEGQGNVAILSLCPRGEFELVACWW